MKKILVLSFILVLVAGFGSLAESAWQVLNGGNPIDNGEEHEYVGTGGAECYRLSILIDKDGNLTYFFKSKKLNLCAGKYNNDTKYWELWTHNGWSSVAGAIARPLSDGLHYTTRFDFVPLNNGDILGTVSAMSQNGLVGLDVHGSLFDFRFNGSDWLRFSGGTSYTKQNFKKINASNWPSPGFGAMASDGNTAIWLTRAYPTWGYTCMVALKFQATAGDSSWKCWDGSSWVTDPSLWSKLPYDSPDTTFIQNIVNLSAGKYLVVFSTPSVYPLNEYCSMRYDDTTSIWEIWTESGWQNATSHAALKSISTDFRFHYRLPSFVANGSGASAFGKKTDVNNSIYELRYSTSSGTWGSSSLVVSDANILEANWSDTCYYRAAVDDDQNIWLVYVSASDDKKLRVIKKTTGGWQAPEDVLVFGNSVSPVGMDFVSGNIPVIFFYSNKRLYAVSTNDTFWNGQHTTIRSGEQAVGMDTSKIEYVTKWNNTSTDEGTGREMTYGAQGSSFLTTDKEGYLYAPHTAVTSVAIFLPNYHVNSSTMDRYWGGGWYQPFQYVSGVAVDNKRGKVYFSDQLDSTDGGGSYGGRITIFEKADRDNFIIIGGASIPQFRSSFRWPADMAVDEERGILYVSDSLHSVIKRFDVVNLTSGKPTYLDSFGGSDLLFPAGIEVDASGNIYVVDSWHHCIRKYDSNKNLIKSWGSVGRGEGQFLYPQSITITIDNNNNLVFVLDPYNTRIQVFDCDGNYKYQWRHSQWETGATAPFVTGVVADNNGHVYVSANRCIYKYNIVSLPAINNVNVSSRTGTSATISWTTDEPSTSQIDYGLDASYGKIASGSALVTSHSLTLTGLTPGTTYHYRVESADGAGNKSTSQDYTFSTLNIFGGKPDKTELKCYNNVFNPIEGEKALLWLELKDRARVKLDIYDMRGERIRKVADEVRESGICKYYWYGRDDSENIVGSGVYFVRIEAGDYKKTKKIVVVK